jgi:hypothetical protein
VPPRALAHVALAFADGGMKYGPYNWHKEKITASVYYGAALRHLNAWWEGEEVASDGVAHHLAHACACLLMILDTMHTEWLQDNRPPSTGSYTDLLAELGSHLTELRDRDCTKFDVHDIV